MTTFPGSASATKWCVGSGLEIGGGAHNPFNLNTLNVDIGGSEAECFKDMERNVCGSDMAIDIQANGDDIPVEDGSQDFVVSSHVLEHFHNPIKALKEWYRVVRPGGIIFMIVPHRDRTFDSGRDRTPLSHVEEDYRFNIDFGHPGEVSGHDHVWITEDVVEIVEYMKESMSIDWDIVEVQDIDDKVGNGFTVVIRKNA